MIILITPGGGSGDSRSTGRSSGCFLFILTVLFFDDGLPFRRAAILVILLVERFGHRLALLRRLGWSLTARLGLARRNLGSRGAGGRATWRTELGHAVLAHLLEMLTAAHVSIFT